MPLPPAGFFSYARFDDEYHEGYLTDLRKRLEGELRVQTGIQFDIFQDREDITWGQAWRARLDESVDTTTFLIPVISPNFMASEACLSEVRRFLAREDDLERSDLILPIYFITTSQNLDAPEDILGVLLDRQYSDWRELRYAELGESSCRRKLSEMAQHLVQAWRRPAPLTQRSLDQFIRENINLADIEKRGINAGLLEWRPPLTPPERYQGPFKLLFATATRMGIRTIPDLQAKLLTAIPSSDRTFQRVAANASSSRTPVAAVGEDLLVAALVAAFPMDSPGHTFFAAWFPEAVASALVVSRQRVG